MPREHELIESGLVPLPERAPCTLKVADPLLQGVDRGSELLHVARAPCRKLAVEALHVARIGDVGRLEVKALLKSLAPIGKALRQVAPEPRMEIFAGLSPAGTGSDLAASAWSALRSASALLAQHSVGWRPPRMAATTRGARKANERLHVRAREPFARGNEKADHGARR